MQDLPPHHNDDAPPDDWLGQAEARALDAALALAPDLGWNDRLARAALRQAQVSAREGRLVLPEGARDLAALLSRRHDRRALAALAQIDASALKVRARIHAAVEARIEAAMRDEAALRRANGFLALPFNAPLAMRLTWESADHLWRWAGDTATDENHYSKRAILSMVLLSTLAARLSGGEAHARAHLGRRIEQVMGFEKWKARLPKPSEAGQDLAGWLGQIRYGAREKAAQHAHGAQQQLSAPAPTPPAGGEGA
jgi:ubiquinone biosynthesis protein COQ9